MGTAIGNAIGIPFGGSGGTDWASYWATQTDVFLFFGQIANISDGQLANEMSGSSDALTVTGSAGSYTFQCPNNATYIAADTDYIWFSDAAIRRTPTEAELIGYDFPRTIVYYDDASPYTLNAIAILKPLASVTNKIRTDFHLSVWWDNILSAYGNLKGNRGSAQSFWAHYTKLLSHFNGADNAVAYTDPVAGAYTFIDGAKLSTGQKKFGTASLNITADGRITIPDSASWTFGSGNFTIDFWFRPTSFGEASNHLCAQCDTLATASKRQSNITCVVTTKKLRFYFWDNAANLLTSSDSTVVFAVDTWYHIAVVRNGNTITGYINGVPQCTLDVTGKTLQDSPEKFVVGNLGEYVSANTYARGYIDEFRISKGIARWIADFSASLPASEYTID